MSKKSFYCWYLGFTEAYGLQGQTKIHEVIKNFLNDQNKQKDTISPSKVTVRLSEANMTLIDSSAPTKRNSRKSRKEQTPKTYMISYDKITYIGRIAQNSDLLTCIVRSDTIIEIGSNTTKKSLFYLHVFRCDSGESAKKLELYLNYFRKLYFKKIEKIQMKQKESFNKDNSKKIPLPSQNEHLINSNLKESFMKRQINKIPSSSKNRIPDNSSAGTQSSSSHNDLSLISPVNSNSSLNHLQREPKYYSRPTSPNIKNINDELIGKIQKGEPLLFPPKDYTQTLVKRGNLPDAQNRRSRNPLIVGREGIMMREINQLNLELNDSFLSPSEQFSPRNQSFNDSNTNRSDFNSLDFNEQQVLNLLDEVVDSVSMVPEYRYEPTSNISNKQTGYEPYSMNDYQTFKNDDDFTKNSLQIIEEENAANKNHNFNNLEAEFFIKRNMSNIKDVARKNNRYKSSDNKLTSAETSNRKKLFSFSSSKSDRDSNPSENNSISAASVGIRTNVLTKLGNWKPKSIDNRILENPQQARFISNNNIDVKKFSDLKHKPSNNSHVYSPYRNEYSSSGLKRISEETNNLYASNNNLSTNSEFILKATDFRSFNEKQSNQNYKNYIRVQDSSRYKTSNLLGTLINVIPTGNANKRISNNFKSYQNNQSNNNVINVYELNKRYDYNEAKKYDLHDIYY